VIQKYGQAQLCRTGLSWTAPRFDGGLPSINSSVSDLEDVFAAGSLQRMRLKHDQKVQEWSGEGYRKAGFDV
jgi:hypothetical protein